VACPYFIPERRMEDRTWIRPPRMPLGALYAGRCAASAEEPPPARQRELCNHGYARGACSCFPPEARADAVRFSFTPEQRLRYVLERDHAPVEHGVIDPASAPAPLNAQARAFLEAFSGQAAAAGGLE
jgi:hypothetical protein